MRNLKQVFRRVLSGVADWVSDRCGRPLRRFGVYTPSGAPPPTQMPVMAHRVYVDGDGTLIFLRRIGLQLCVCAAFPAAQWNGVAELLKEGVEETHDH